MKHFKSNRLNDEYVKYGVRIALFQINRLRSTNKCKELKGILCGEVTIRLTNFRHTLY